MLIYTRQSSGRKRKNRSKKFLAAQQNHLRFLASHGISKNKKVKCRVNFPDLSVPSKNVSPVSNQIPGNGFKRTVDDYRWRKGREEKPEVIAETERKKKQITVTYNKGPIMFLCQSDDLTLIGKKV